MNISIRTEQEKDYQLVEALTRAAFAYPERVARGGIGCPYEHWMVHDLRKSGFHGNGTYFKLPVSRKGWEIL